MGVPCPLPCISKNETDISDHQSNSNSNFHSDTASNSSLYSQPSLPSVPSLTPPSQHVEQPSNTYHHVLANLKGHSSYVFSLALAGKHLYSCSSNGEIRIWSRDQPTDEYYSTINSTNLVAQGNSAIKSVVILGDKLFTAHQDHKIRVWKIDNHDDPTHLKKYKRIATLPTLNDRCVRVLSAKNYVKVRRHKKSTWVHHIDAVSALALSKDCSLLYSVSWDRTFKIWRTSDFKCLESVWNAHEDAINAIVLSHDGLFIYTGSADKKIKVWRKQDQGDKKHTSLVATLEKHKSAVNALALSTDGTVLYSGACDRSIVVWEKNSSCGQHMVVVGALRGHTKAILCLTVVSDLVCSGSADKTVRIWKRDGVGKSYCCLAVLEGHRGPVKCLTATADNNHARDNSSSDGISYKVYSGSLDCDIKVWKIWVPFV
ncbi:hypothetical protein ACH5RR_030635 [Cinchona calisaya]|uniref:Uncharacterized protein n=1 Tax=Cinchona calisaya TaxID=153742 RepID=A0ABD2YWI4_9GENT